MHRLLIALCIYPALGIAAFGAAIAQLAKSAIWPGAGLWFAGGLLVYNLDRGVADPADAHNTPHRRPDQDRNARRVIMALAVLTLLLLSGPHLWYIVLPGAIGCLAYSLPICGVRIKDLPAVKTLFPPLAITVAYAAIASIDHWPLLSWTFLVLSSTSCFATSAIATATPITAFGPSPCYLVRAPAPCSSFYFS